MISNDDGDDDMTSGLRCAVCMDLFKSPRSLKCGHTFCATCIRSVIEQTRFFENRFPCPECRQQTPKGTEYPINIAIQRAVDQLRCSTGTCRVTALDQLLVICKHCKSRFCRGCLLAHREQIIVDLRCRASSMNESLKTVRDIDLTKLEASADACLKSFEMEADAHAQTISNFFMSALDSHRTRLIEKASPMIAELFMLTQVRQSLENIDNISASIEDVKEADAFSHQKLVNLHDQMVSFEMLLNAAGEAACMQGEIVELDFNFENFAKKFKDLLQQEMRVVRRLRGGQSHKVTPSRKFMDGFASGNWNYFASFQKTLGNVIFQGTSDVQAILVRHNRSAMLKNEYPQVLVVSHLREVVALSQSDWGVVAWRAKILPTANHQGDFKILDAVYDQQMDEIYFINLNWHDTDDPDNNVYRVSVADLEKDSAGRGVQSTVLIGAAENDNKHVHSLAIDSLNRLLISCDDERNSITIFKLVGDGTALKIRAFELTSPAHAAILPIDDQDSKILKIFDDPQSSCMEKRLVIAVSSQARNYVTLHLMKITENDNKPESIEIVGTHRQIAGQFTGRHDSDDDDEREVRDKPLGSVNYPLSMQFDKFGNLVVMDGRNRRVQVFSLVEDDNGVKMTATWGSDDVGKQLFRTAITINLMTGEPEILVSDIDECWIAPVSKVH